MRAATTRSFPSLPRVGPWPGSLTQGDRPHACLPPANNPHSLTISAASGSMSVLHARTTAASLVNSAGTLRRARSSRSAGTPTTRMPRDRPSSAAGGASKKKAGHWRGANGRRKGGGGARDGSGPWARDEAGDTAAVHAPLHPGTKKKVFASGQPDFAGFGSQQAASVNVGPLACYACCAWPAGPQVSAHPGTHCKRRPYKAGQGRSLGAAERRWRHGRSARHAGAGAAAAAANAPCKQPRRLPHQRAA